MPPPYPPPEGEGKSSVTLPSPRGGGRTIQLVAEKEIGISKADAQQPAALEGPTEIYAPDEPERLTLLADEFGRDSQEELVDAIGGNELTEQMRTPFGQDGLIALRLQCRKYLVDADAVSVGHAADLISLWQGLSELLGRRVGGENQRSDLERPLGRIKVTACSDDDKPRGCVSLERSAQRRESFAGRGEDVIRRPESLATFRTDGAGAYQHGIGERAQEAHHKAISLVPSADDSP